MYKKCFFTELKKKNKYKKLTLNLVFEKMSYFILILMTPVKKKLGCKVNWQRPLNVYFS